MNREEEREKVVRGRGLYSVLWQREMFGVEGVLSEEIEGVCGDEGGGKEVGECVFGGRGKSKEGVLSEELEGKERVVRSWW